MHPKNVLSKLCLTAALVTVLAPGCALASTFNWKFAAAGISGSGTLTATPYGSPGEFDITGGSGTVISSIYGTFAVTFDLCAPAGNTCTIQNSDGQGSNLSYDNLLFTTNAPGGELDGNGIVLAPGPPGSNTLGINIFDTPSQEFYSYGPGGFQNLTTPFTVTPFAATPEPEPFIMVGSGLLGLYLRRRKNRE